LPSNRACTIDFKKAEELSEAGYFYTLHRFYKYSEVLHWVLKNQNLKTISISIGVKGVDYDFLKTLSEEPRCRVDFITIDVAHGHNINVKKICNWFHVLPWSVKPKLIVGNIGTIEGARDLISWGADAIKVGLSMGKACTTYNTTGVGTPMYSTVKEINETISFVDQSNVPLIADGQIREIGDVSKALHAGASMVMVGSMFAACEDSPAESNFFNTHKIFYGSASAKNKGSDKYVEGQEGLFLELKKYNYIDLLNKFEQGIRSTMSYAGVTDVKRIYLMGVRQIYV
jgi:GMP reductase